MCDIPVFIDLQGFIVKKEFIVKEVAILRQGAELAHYIFRPPISWNLLTDGDRRTVNWLFRNHHGLDWNAGEIDYSQAHNLIATAIHGVGKRRWDYLTNRIIHIYVKGLQKKTWLQQLLGSCTSQYNIKTMEDEFQDIGRLQNLDNDQTLRCVHHRYVQTCCAQENVMTVYSWWRKQQAGLMAPMDK